MTIFKNKIGRSSNETLKKRRIIKAILFAIVFVIVFTLAYTLSNINSKRLKGESNAICDSSSACYQAGFRDENFYHTVIDKYNSSYGGNLTYNDTISDEQLAEIETLVCNSGTISSITGIEKMINLNTLEIVHVGLSSVDLSNNRELKSLKLQNNNISSIDLTNNVNLIYLNLKHNNLSEINLTNNTNLESAYLSENGLNAVTLGENSKLISLNLSYNNLHSVSLDGLPNLGTLIVDNNELDTINLSNNKELFWVELSYNNLNTIDLSMLSNLEILNLSNNSLSEINLTNNDHLYDLSLHNNNLNTVDLSNNIYLTRAVIDKKMYLKKGEQIDLPVTLPSDFSNIMYEFNDFFTNNDVSSYVIVDHGKISSTYNGMFLVRITYNNSNGEAGFCSVGNITSYDFSSDKYSVYNNLGVIDTGNDSDDEVISNISVDVGSVVASYACIEDNKLKICLGMESCNTLLDEYTLIRYRSDKYNLDDGFVYVGDKSLNINDIQTENCEKELINNHLVIKYQGSEITRIPVIKLETDYDIVNDYMYIGADEFDESKIDVINGYFVENNDSLNIYDNDSNFIKTIQLSKISSDKYNITDNIIEVTDDFDEEYINVLNGFIEYDSDSKKLYVIVDDVIVKEYNIKKTSNDDKPTNTKTETSKTTLTKFNDNAKTYDDVVKYFVLAGISFIIIVGVVIYIKKKNS